MVKMNALLVCPCPAERRGSLPAWALIPCAEPGNATKSPHTLRWAVALTMAHQTACEPRASCRKKLRNLTC